MSKKLHTILRAVALNGMAILNLWSPMIPAKPKEIIGLIIGTAAVLEAKRVFDLDPNDGQPPKEN